MIDIVSVYEDVKDDVSVSENGALSVKRFNRYSKRAELKLIDLLTGRFSGEGIPQPYINQKNKDWLSFLITKKDGHINNGLFPKPDDYYAYDNFYKIGMKAANSCDENEDEDHVDEGNTIIEIMDGDKFSDRLSSYIEELAVTAKKPIAKIVGKNFVVAPSDLGSASIEYIRYPKYGYLQSFKDPVYNIEVPQVGLNYEWDESARDILVWLIVDLFAVNTREAAIKQINQNPAQ